MLSSLSVIGRSRIIQGHDAGCQMKFSVSNQFVFSENVGKFDIEPGHSKTYKMRCHQQRQINLCICTVSS